MSCRAAVVGANGKLGSELCLRLSRCPSLEVIPIVRNEAGSAYLRLQGLTCRHGRVAECQEAPGLLGDCDVVVNLAYSVPRSRRMHLENLSLAQNAVTAAAPSARIVFASTIMV